MIKALVHNFLFIFYIACTISIFGQQKIAVYDDVSALPIYDVNVVIYGKDVVPDGDGWKIQPTLGGYTLVEDHYTNKKGKIQTDIFNLADTQWRISFYHEDYISKTLTLKDSKRNEFQG